MLWDYDGTIVDTQPIWMRVEQDIMASFGREWTDEQALAVVGTSGRAACQAMIAAIGDPNLDVDEMDMLRSRMVAEWVAANTLSYRPGAQSLLDGCRAAGIPCALVSSSRRFVVAAGLSRMPDWFAVTLSGEDFAGQKPDPEGYLLAAERLGVRPEHCLVVEDSVSGCAAGLASGAAVLAVPCMTALDPVPGQVVRQSLAEVAVADLPAIVAEARASMMPRLGGGPTRRALASMMS